MLLPPISTNILLPPFGIIETLTALYFDALCGSVQGVPNSTRLKTEVHLLRFLMLYLF